MIQEFVDKFMANEQAIRAELKAAHPNSYRDIVQLVVEHIGGDGYGAPDPSRIHQIDDGDYQGTLVFVIASDGYQPHDYWFAKVWYGSCSGCDTLQSIRDASSWSEPKPTQAQVDDYWTLALHVAQGLKAME